MEVQGELKIQSEAFTEIDDVEKLGGKTKKILPIS